MIEKMSILIFMSVFFALSITETHIIGVAFLYDLLTELNSRYRNSHYGAQYSNVRHME